MLKKAIKLKGGRSNNIILLFFLLFLLRSSLGFAQVITVRDKDRAIFEIFERLREIEMDMVLSATEEALKEKILAFAPLRLHPYGSLTFTYDDNIYLLPDKTSAIYSLFEPGLIFNTAIFSPSGKDIPRNKFEVDAGIKIVTYTNHSRLNRQNPYIGILTEVGRGDHQLAFSYDFSLNSTPTSELSGGQEGLSDYKEDVTNLSYEAMYKRLGYALEYTRTASYYDGEYKSSSLQEHLFSLTGFLRPRSLPKTRFLLGFELGLGEYIHAASSDNNYIDSKIWLGIKGNLTKKTTGLIRSGYQNMDYKAIADTTVIPVTIDLDYQYSPLTNFKLTIDRRDQQASYVTESVQEGTSFSLGCFHTFAANRKLSASLSFDYSTDDYSAGRSDNTYGFSTELAYVFRKWMSMSLGYSYEERDSTISDNDYKNNIFTLATRAVF